MDLVKMKNWLFMILYVGVMVSYLVGIFLIEDILIFTSWLVVISLLLSIFYVRGVSLGLSIFFLVFGSLILYNQGVASVEYLESIRGMVYIFTLVSVIRFLGFPMELGGYSEAVKRVVHREVKGEGILYITTTLIAYLIGMSIVVACVPVVYYTIEKAVEKLTDNPEKFLSISIKRGLFLALLWTPSSPLMAMSLEVSQASWFSVFPVAILLSFFGFGLDLLIDLPTYWDKEEVKLMSPGEETKEERKKDFSSIRNLVIILIFLIVLLVTVDSILEDYTMIYIVILTSIFFAPLWSFVIGRGKFYTEAVMGYIKNTIPGFKQQFTLFISAGYFASATGYAGDEVASYLGGIINFTGELLFLMILSSFVVIFAIIGVHPIISIAVFGESLAAVSHGMPDNWVAFSFLLGGAVALLVSPFSAATLVTAELVHKTPFRVGVLWNGLFGLYIMLAGFLLLYVWDLLI
ncbi:hypothetical protein [Natranaerofaba carboxydovora]|uniref:hypothetical protein n=1 Tax=Natranaerofaba carboxydovora TaxID=2742683 RepID=UPI001F12B4C8|nr:hypothetical protein [Natranaerofaba carboxydovora]UMZ74931.1 hypothetical protein ACONDI_02535 [Natranaerofaba carboxydovora]